MSVLLGKKMGSPRCALSVAVKENGMLVYVCVLSKGDDFYFFPCKLCPENTFEANVNLSFIFHSVFSLCLEEKKSIPSRMNWSPPSLEPPVVPSQDMMLTHFWRRHPPPPPSTSPPTRGSRRGKNDDAIVLQMTKYSEIARRIDRLCLSQPRPGRDGDVPRQGVTQFVQSQTTPRVGHVIESKNMASRKLQILVKVVAFAKYRLSELAVVCSSPVPVQRTSASSKNWSRLTSHTRHCGLVWNGYRAGHTKLPQVASSST
ncbi:hypothetical protein RRG08_031110 [Elysia crispata]|uniref:Uncharacterized protein n=1 Tax=Elysia crispata TaxID=231223 RepID=A0AAE0ZFE4_9GAST|nr:hypothetical protein RRG08_031110 [Elysia crispata]